MNYGINWALKLLDVNGSFISTIMVHYGKIQVTNAKLICIVWCKKIVSNSFPWLSICINYLLTMNLWFQLIDWNSSSWIQNNWEEGICFAHNKWSHVWFTYSDNWIYWIQHYFSLILIHHLSNNTSPNQRIVIYRMKKSIIININILPEKNYKRLPTKAFTINNRFNPQCS